VVNNPRLVSSTFVYFVPFVVKNGKTSNPQEDTALTAKSAKDAKGKPNPF
jgi:hypothetical protein